MNQKRVTIKLSPEAHAYFADLARKDRRALSVYIEMILDKQLPAPKNFGSFQELYEKSKAE